MARHSGGVTGFARSMWCQHPVEIHFPDTSFELTVVPGEYRIHGGMIHQSPEHVERISRLLAELGIPEDYPVRRSLFLHEEATELVSIGNNPEGKPCRLIRPAAKAWHSMYAAARKLEIELIPLSGFRSVERQVEIIRGKLAVGERIGDILQSIAAPGYSEHHTGRAIDIGCEEAPPLEIAFADTRAYAWLKLHAEEHGFTLSYPENNPHGFVYEPWHWCWHQPA